MKTHPFHLVDRSPWPFYASLSSLTLVVGLVASMHSYTGGFSLFLVGIFDVFMVAAFWWRDVIRESTYGGFHTLPVQKGLAMGFSLFLVSEVMFFFSFFWSFFYLSSNPAIEVGGVWPPTGIESMSATGIPLVNTLLLVWSGITLTYSHNRLVAQDLPQTVCGLTLTLTLGFIFLVLQVYEYRTAQFDISDGVYGSLFYLLTGFHGFHVIIGFLFLLVNLIRTLNWHFYRTSHLGYLFGAWYWHFVDVVWLGLYFSVYVWGNY